MIDQPDPRGAVGTRRLRRTLAWHIARRLLEQPSSDDLAHLAPEV